MIDAVKCCFELRPWKSIVCSIFEGMEFDETNPTDDIVTAESITQRKRIKDWWPWFLGASLAILMFEWWIYNKKMFL